MNKKLTIVIAMLAIMAVIAVPLASANTDTHTWTYYHDANMYSRTMYHDYTAYNATIQYHISLANPTADSVYSFAVGLLDSSDSGGYIFLNQTGLGTTQVWIWQCLNGNTLGMTKLASWDSGAEYLQNVTVSYDGTTATYIANGHQTVYTQSVTGASLHKIMVNTDAVAIDNDGYATVRIDGYWAGTSGSTGGDNAQLVAEQVNNVMPLIIIVVLVAVIGIGALILIKKIGTFGNFKF